MKTLFNILRGYVIFVGGSGFLFGQLFFNNFSLAASLAGFGGVLAAILGWPATNRPGLNSLIVFCAIAGMIGVGMDAYHYYTKLNSSGNYYAWFMIGPYTLFLFVIGLCAALARKQSK